MPTTGFTALFERQASGAHRPLENFTSTMVALAGNAHARPIVVALQTAQDRARPQARDTSGAGALRVRLPMPGRLLSGT